MWATSVYFQASLATKPAAAVRALHSTMLFMHRLCRSAVHLCLFLPLSLRKHLLHTRHYIKLSGRATFGCCWSYCSSPWLYISCQLVLEEIHRIISLLAPLQPSGRIRSLHLLRGTWLWQPSKECLLRDAILRHPGQVLKPLESVLRHLGCHCLQIPSFLPSLL